MKLFDFLSIYRRLRAGRIVAVSFNVSGRCNCKCRMCAKWQGEGGTELAFKEIQRIFSQIAEQGIRIAEITGGEPFLRKDIFEILDFLEGLGFYYTINTHGGLLDDERLEKLAGYRNILDFAISLDTLDRENYLALRGVDQLERVVENIKKVRAIMPDKIVKLSMTVSRNNYKELPAILSFARDHGFYLSVFPVNLGNDFIHRGECRDLVPTQQERGDMVALFHQLAKLRKKGEILCEFSKFYQGAADYIESGSVGRCGAGRLFLDLHADGKLSVCNDLPPFADLMKISFKEALSRIEGEKNKIKYCYEHTPCYYTCSYGITHIAENTRTHILELMRIAGMKRVWHFLFPLRSRFEAAGKPIEETAMGKTEKINGQG